MKAVPTSRQKHILPAYIQYAKRETPVQADVVTPLQPFRAILRGQKWHWQPEFWASDKVLMLTNPGSSLQERKQQIK